MITANLSKVNLTENIIANYKSIEAILGVEIEKVYNYKNGIEHSYTIKPDDHCNGEFPITFQFRPFTMVNRPVSFDHETGIMVIRGRNKWQRGEKDRVFQFQKVGYKLKTTKLSEGWIWGEPTELTDK